MSIASPCRNLTREILILLVALALAGAKFSARAQSGTDDRELKCTATLMAGLVEHAGKAYCRGYLGQSCTGEEYANACNDGAHARARRGETGGAQRNLSEAEELEKNRRLVERLPRMPPEGNLLLGRWRNVQAPPPSNPLEGLTGLGTGVACRLIAGGGPSFEFRTDALVHGSRTMDSIRYYRGKEGVVFALGERYLRLLAFEFHGRDRITNGTCNFERVGAVAAAKAPLPSPQPAAAQSAQALPPITYAPVDPRSALGKGIALNRNKDFQPALQQFLAATAANPSDARGWVFLADTYRWLGLERDGESALAKALKLDPNALNILH